MIEILQGDCRDVMRSLIERGVRVDAIVTDPPYELTSKRPGGRSEATKGAVMGGFMGMRWDGTGVAFDPETWALALDLLKPGGHLLAFGGTRTYHRLACAIEDAGFEIRDCIFWCYGSGFPKSLDVSKAIDKSERGAMVRAKLLHFANVRGITGKWLEERGVASASSFADWTIGGHVPGEKNWQIVKEALGITSDEEAAYEREVVGQGMAGLGQGRFHSRDAGAGGYGYGAEYDITTPATDAARQWQGWGTALKPAVEPIVVARKPLEGTVAENVQAYGTGAINIDACRIEAERATGWGGGGSKLYEGGLSREGGDARLQTAGRWPANLVHDGSEEVVALFPQGAGAAAPVTKRNADKFRTAYGAFKGDVDEQGSTFRGDTGSAARFFYCAKASKKDRREFNSHPTVKPTDLMRWLVRMVTPRGGVVLDPFLGSGSTGRAAVHEGFQFIGIEREQEYVDIAWARIGEVLTEGLV